MIQRCLTRCFVFLYLLSTFFLPSSCKSLATSDSITNDENELGTVYANTWVVYVEGGETFAKKLALRINGVNYLGKVGGLLGYYRFEHVETQKRHRRSSDHITRIFSANENIKYAKQQELLLRQHRGYFTDPLYQRHWYLENQGKCKNVKNM